MNTKLSYQNKMVSLHLQLAKGGVVLYVDGVGLCSNNYEFTAKAKDYIDNGEYRF